MIQFDKLTALVVDDDPILRKMVGKELESIGVKFKAVSNGNEAIEALKEKRFDFVLMDIQMPVQDGLDAVRWIRDINNKYHQNLPIIAVTSFEKKEHTVGILEAGMNDHIVKPFTLEKFMFSINKILG
jgi:CheY-like chemotaxis protein